MYASFNQTLNFEKTRMKKDFHSINIAAYNGPSSPLLNNNSWHDMEIYVYLYIKYIYVYIYVCIIHIKL